MLPTLKRVQSVDYAALSQQRAASSTTSRNPLMHSISIVVELAREPPRDGLEEEESEADTCSSQISEKKSIEQEDEQLGELRKTKLALMGSTESYAEEGDNEEEEEEEDDDRDCLSSDLARKVVIVDEADKILRTRASSTEPQKDMADGPTKELFTSGRGQKPAIPPRPPNMRSSTMIEDRGRKNWPPSEFDLNHDHGANSATCGGEGSLSGNSMSKCASLGGSAHGEFGPERLGMRRNTHHSVNLDRQAASGASALGACVRPMRAKQKQHTRSGSAQLDPQAMVCLAALKGDSGNSVQVETIGNAIETTPTKLGSPINRNWSQRRQSLQFSLLAGRSPSRSLREEELRGEREFNEQVRGSKASDLQATYNLQRRCQSAAPDNGAEATFEPHSELDGELCLSGGVRKQQSIVKAKQLQQQQQLPSSRRRVSFGSIDPILTNYNRTNSKASFAFHSTYRSQLFPAEQQQEAIDIKAIDPNSERKFTNSESSRGASSKVEGLTSGGGLERTGCATFVARHKRRSHSLAGNPFASLPGDKLSHETREFYLPELSDDEADSSAGLNRLDFTGDKSGQPHSETLCSVASSIVRRNDIAPLNWRGSDDAQTQNKSSTVAIETNARNMDKNETIIAELANGARLESPGKCCLNGLYCSA